MSVNMMKIASLNNLPLSPSVLENILKKVPNSSRLHIQQTLQGLVRRLPLPPTVDSDRILVSMKNMVDAQETKMQKTMIHEDYFQEDNSSPEDSSEESGPIGECYGMDCEVDSLEREISETKHCSQSLCLERRSTCDYEKEEWKWCDEDPMCAGYTDFFN